MREKIVQWRGFMLLIGAHSTLVPCTSSPFLSSSICLLIHAFGERCESFFSRADIRIAALVAASVLCSLDCLFANYTRGKLFLLDCLSCNFQFAALTRSVL